MTEQVARQRRQMHVKRSALLRGITERMDHPVLKWVETQNELEKAFSLVHEEYLRAGYIQETSPRVYFNIHNLLPNSSTLVIKNNSNIIATLSMVTDGNEFGLPMDALYAPELESLRSQGRKVCELCTLAISRNFQSCRLYVPLFRTMYWHAVNNSMDDICIIVNPRHASFYKTIFLFEDFGT